MANFFVISYSARDCGLLSVPTNGSSSGNLTTFPNKVVFGCDDGFILVGSDTRGCQANGSWSGSQTFCQGGYNSTLVWFFPPYVWCFCFVSSSSRKSIFWPYILIVIVLFEFIAVDCGPLPDPMNGSSSGGLTVFPNIVVFGCDPGFILKGSSERTCQTNGNWSGSSSICNGKLNNKVKIMSLFES